MLSSLNCLSGEALHFHTSCSELNQSHLFKKWSLSIRRSLWTEWESKHLGMVSMFRVILPLVFFDNSQDVIREVAGVPWEPEELLELSLEKFHLGLLPCQSIPHPLQDANTEHKQDEFKPQQQQTRGWGTDVSVLTNQSSQPPHCNSVFEGWKLVTLSWLKEQQKCHQTCG